MIDLIIMMYTTYLNIVFIYFIITILILITTLFINWTYNGES